MLDLADKKQFTLILYFANLTHVEFLGLEL